LRAELIDEIVRSTGIQKRNLIEKELKIHGTLRHLSLDSWFRESFLFEGGTCLIKGFLGYYRFSEDIDFTYKEQSDFEGLSGKKVRDELSTIIDKLGVIFEEIAELENPSLSVIKTIATSLKLEGATGSVLSKFGMVKVLPEVSSRHSSTS
jgi:predicted nucleotidyltransferase component of viral defense system